jgi:acetyltransferase-like isoleucine patch superfamily enzyme
VTERLRALGIIVAGDAKFYGMPIVALAGGSNIEIGSKCILCSDSEKTPLGVHHAVVLRTLRPGARIRLGPDVGMSGGSICAAISVDIGAECLIGANVTIADTDFHPLNPANRRHSDDEAQIGAARVVIEDNVFIGAGSFILKGVRIGKNSIIGAASVVTEDIPADSIACGNPARVVRGLAKAERL